MVTLMEVDILAPTVREDACVEDYDDVVVPLLVGLANTFKVLPLLKCMHIEVYFHKKVHRNSYQFLKTVFTRIFRK